MVKITPSPIFYLRVGGQTMRRIVSVLVCVSLITYPALVLAEECREPRAVTRPCEGVLLPPQAAAKALKCLEVSLPKLELELAREK